MKYAALFFLICTLHPLHCQEIMVLPNSKSFKASPTWYFRCDNYILNDSIAVQIARTDKGGFLSVAVKSTDQSFAIAGNLYVDLKNFTSIRCTDKSIRTTRENQIISFYVFNAAEMKLLQQSDIDAIRFQIKGKKSKFSSQTGYFTAVNKKKFFHTRYNFEMKYYETANAIRNLSPEL